ncbi:hypothetical protein M0812_26828 [Anaeramoeba flamelloides]|uniref:Uncharacterized protein n=1 Tax=Anaeramoeba flamelloides TaxID=1746091 RepID=A0AAV7YI46_9EUKA|nr:hypothetical protein M0812_26828 [Anaeramoeba flamelloides]
MDTKSIKNLIRSEKARKYLREKSKNRRKNYHQKKEKTTVNYRDRAEERRTGIFQSGTKPIKGLDYDILAQQKYEERKRKIIEEREKRILATTDGKQIQVTKRKPKEFTFKTPIGKSVALYLGSVFQRTHNKQLFNHKVNYLFEPDSKEGSTELLDGVPEVETLEKKKSVSQLTRFSNVTHPSKFLNDLKKIRNEFQQVGFSINEYQKTKKRKDFELQATEIRNQLEENQKKILEIESRIISDKKKDIEDEESGVDMFNFSSEEDNNVLERKRQDIEMVGSKSKSQTKKLKKRKKN